jgi:hypothetical protein
MPPRPRKLTKNAPRPSNRYFAGKAPTEDVQHDFDDSSEGDREEENVYPEDGDLEISAPQAVASASVAPVVALKDVNLEERFQLDKQTEQKRLEEERQARMEAGLEDDSEEAESGSDEEVGLRLVYYANISLCQHLPMRKNLKRKRSRFRDRPLSRKSRPFV